MLREIGGYLYRLQRCIDNLDKNEIDNFIKVLLSARDKGKTIYVMGNGGSAATASHFCCDFNKGMSYNQNKKFKMFCLNDNVATMLAYSNDVDYSDIFVEQLKNFLNEGDVVVAISGSGNSKNIVKAVEYANSKNAVTIGLTGFDGGLLKEIAQHSVNANVDDMQITEDIHMMFCHLTYSVLMNKDSNIIEESVLNHA